MTGEKLFIDIAGPTIGLTNGTPAHICIAALGAFALYVCLRHAVRTMADWLSATGRALEFIGGVPQLIASDDSRTVSTPRYFWCARAGRTKDEDLQFKHSRQVATRSNHRLRPTANEISDRDPSRHRFAAAANIPPPGALPTALPTLRSNHRLRL